MVIQQLTLTLKNSLGNRTKTNPVLVIVKWLYTRPTNPVHGGPTHCRWYHFSQSSHCTISPYVSAIRQVQYSSISCIGKYKYFSSLAVLLSLGKLVNFFSLIGQNTRMWTVSASPGEWNPLVDSTRADIIN